MVDERGSREICRTANRMGIFRVIRSHCFEHAPSPFYPLQPADLSIPSHPIPSPSQFPRSCHNLITCINHPLACKKITSELWGGKRRVRRGNPKCYEIWFVRKSGEDLPSHGHRWGRPSVPIPHWRLLPRCWEMVSLFSLDFLAGGGRSWELEMS